MKEQYSLDEVIEIAKEAIKIHRDIEDMSIRQAISYSLAIHEDIENYRKERVKEVI